MENVIPKGRYFSSEEVQIINGAFTVAQKQIERLTAVNAELLATLKLPLLFHSGGEWTVQKAETWGQITGTNEATSKVMCDCIRAAIKKAEQEERTA